DRQPFGVGRIVDGGRQERQRVVHVRDRGSLSRDYGSEIAVRLLVPDRPLPQRQRRQGSDIVVVSRVADDVVTSRLQEPDLVGDDQILSSGLLIVVVNKQ